MFQLWTRVPQRPCPPCMEQTEGPTAIPKCKEIRNFPRLPFMLLKLSLFSHFLERDGYRLGSLFWGLMPVMGWNMCPYHVHLMLIPPDHLLSRAWMKLSWAVIPWRISRGRKKLIFWRPFSTGGPFTSAPCLISESSLPKGHPQTWEVDNVAIISLVFQL